MNEVCGDGDAELQPDGSLHGKFDTAAAMNSPSLLKKWSLNYLVGWKCCLVPVPPPRLNNAFVILGEIDIPGTNLGVVDSEPGRPSFLQSAIMSATHSIRN